MAEAYKGLIAEIKAEVWAEGWDESQRNIIMRMLDDYSLEEVAEFLIMTPSEISNKIKKVD